MKYSDGYFGSTAEMPRTVKVEEKKMITQEKINELREKARKYGNSWKVGYDDGSGKFSEEDSKFCISDENNNPIIHAKDFTEEDDGKIADYIASSQSTILELLDHLEALQRQNKAQVELTAEFDDRIKQLQDKNEVMEKALCDVLLCFSNDLQHYPNLKNQIQSIEAMRGNL